MADGAALLDEVAAAIDRYVITPSAHARDGVVLWIAATHAQQAWNNAPRLVINSPEKRCGKTRLLEVIAALCHRPMFTANVSTAVLYRVIGEQPPTILLDEADTVFGTKTKAEQNEDLRGLLNAGHSRAATTWRCVGPQQTPTEFPVFAMAALAGIGALPDTITDRAVNLTMRRRMTGEQVQPYRQRRDAEPLHQLRDQLAVWLGEHLADLERADPVLPVEDRAADNWTALVAVADLAGGDWPTRARAAARRLTAEHDKAESAESLNVHLLRDIARLRRTWTEPFIGSAKLAAQLRSDDTAPWAEIDLTPRRLFTRLKTFGITARHNTSRTERGYWLADFDDAIARYPSEDEEDAGLPADPASGYVQASETPSDLRESPDAHEPLDVSIRPAHDASGYVQASTDVSIRPEPEIRPTETAGQTVDRTHGRIRTDNPRETQLDVTGVTPVTPSAGHAGGAADHQVASGEALPADTSKCCPICSGPTSFALVATASGPACRRCAPGIRAGTTCSDCGHPRDLVRDGRCNPCHGRAIRRPTDLQESA